jgi:hypothetical protein
MTNDFIDMTPEPTPSPKKVYRWPQSGETVLIPWAVGQTFQQAIGAAIPAAIRNKTLAFSATIRLVIDVKED